MKLLILGAFALVATAQPTPDVLPRRGYFGVALEQSPAGVRVTGVTPGSTAAEAGVAAGDMITTIDGRAVDTTATAIGAIGRHRTGESILIGIARNGEMRTIPATLKPYPSEQIENATVSYASVESQPGIRLRTITTVPVKPSLERYPAFLLIQGGGCSSIESPFGPLTGPPAFIGSVAGQGFITMRVDKPGVGDSQGEPCASIGFKEEFAGYQAALKALLSHPAVDRDRVYLFGLSLGGVFAPLLAADTHVAGISVYGTPAGPTPVYPGRSERFFQEFAKVDVAGAWAKVNTRVQVLHGEYDADPVVNRAVHESIAAMINKAHPGSATFREFAGLDHCWTRHPSLEASKDRCGEGEQTLLVQEDILNFLMAR